MSLWNNWYNTFNNPFSYWSSPFNTVDPRWLNTGTFGWDEIFGYGDPRLGFRGNGFNSGLGYGYGVPGVGFGVNPMFGGLQNVNPFLGNTLGWNGQNFGINPIFSNLIDATRFGFGFPTSFGFPTTGLGVNPMFSGLQNVNPFFGYGSVSSYGIPAGVGFNGYGVTSGFGGVGFNGYGVTPGFGGVGYGFGVTPNFGGIPTGYASNFGGYGYPTTNNTWNTVPYASGYFTGGGIGNEWRNSVTSYPQNGTLVGSIDNRR